MKPADEKCKLSATISNDGTFSLAKLFGINVHFYTTLLALHLGQHFVWAAEFPIMSRALG